MKAAARDRNLLSVSLSPVTLVRMAGVPSGFLWSLGNPDLDEAITRYWEAETAWCRSREKAQDRIFRRVPHASRSERRLLLEVKRRLRTSVNLLDSEAPDCLAALNEVRQAYLAARDYLAAGVRLADVFQETQQRERAFIDERAGDAQGAFAKGLALASPSLSERWRRSKPTSRRKARDRRAEEAIFAYLVRAATKTSPFSRFTVVSWCDRDIPGLSATDEWAESTLDHAAVRRLLLAVAASEDWDCLQVYRNPCVIRDTSHYWGYVWTDRKVAPAGRWERGEERFIRIPRTGSIDRIWDALAQPPVSARAFITGVSAGEGSYPAAAAYVHGLIGHGLLHLAPPLPEIAEDYDRSLRDWLASIDGEERPWVRSLRHALDLSDALSSSDADMRLQLVRRMSAQLREANVALSGDSREAPSSGVEDVYLAGPLPERPRLQEGDVRDMQTLALTSSLCDQLIGRKWRMARYFEASFGHEATVPLLEFYRRYAEHCVQHQDDEGSGEIVAALRKTVTKALVSAARTNDSGLRVSTEAVRQGLLKVPANVPRARVCAAFVQSSASRRAEWVVNRLEQGHGRYFSRFANGLDRAGARVGRPLLIPRLQERQRQTAGKHELIVDIDETFGASVNRRPLIQPGVLHIRSSRVRPLECEQLSAAELYVRRYSEWELVLCDASGRRIVPVEMGFLVRPWLPRLAKFLLEFAQPRPSTIVPWYDVWPHLTARGVAPRVYFGSVILYRRTWNVAASELPRRSGATSEPEYLAEVAQWRRTSGVPNEVFVTLDPATRSEGEPSRTSPDEQRSETFRRKPQYLNLSSPMFLPRVERVFESAHLALSISEVFPPLPAEGSVKEYVVEFETGECA